MTSLAEKFFERFSLGVIFRHFLSGGIYIAALVYTQFGATSRSVSFLREQGGILSVAAIFAGSLLYALHRGISNPIFELLRHYICDCKCLKWCRYVFLAPRVEIMLHRRWEFGSARKSACDHITDWADYVHFLYTSGFAVWLGSVSPVIYLGREKMVFDNRIFWLGAVCVIAGFITDYRKHIIEDAIYPEKPNKKACIVANPANTRTG